MSLRFDVPVDPDSDTARRWVEQEMSRSDYHSTGNDWFARLMDWLANLLSKRPNFGDGGAPGGIPAWIVAGAIVAVVLAVAAFLVFGPLRSSGRRRKSKTIFDDDTRDLGSIRDAALDAAARGDWSRATLERFRAIVRTGEKEDLVAVTPGMTAGEFARDCARRLRALESDFDWAADTFDGLRYADAQATKTDYDRMTAIESSLAEVRAARDVS